jgi:small nuclear ribonucleoprotein (snRNP)-like protein
MCTLCVSSWIAVRARSGTAPPALFVVCSDVGSCPLPPSVATQSVSKSAKMLHYVNFRMKVTIQDGRTLVGTLMAFDKHMNLVLGDCEESRRVKAKKATGGSGCKQGGGGGGQHGGAARATTPRCRSHPRVPQAALCPPPPRLLLHWVGARRVRARTHVPCALAGPSGMRVVGFFQPVPAPLVCTPDG